MELLAVGCRLLMERLVVAVVVAGGDGGDATGRWGAEVHVVSPLEDAERAD